MECKRLHTISSDIVRKWETSFDIKYPSPFWILKSECVKMLSSGYGQGMVMVLLLGWLFLPIYIASGVRCTCRQSNTPHTTWTFCYFVQFFFFISPGNNNARILAEAFRWEKNTVVYSRPVLVYLHFHKDIGMIEIHINPLLRSTLPCALFLKFCTLL